LDDVGCVWSLVEKNWLNILPKKCRLNQNGFKKEVWE
jgi:hypothetical protein